MLATILAILGTTTASAFVKSTVQKYGKTAVRLMVFVIAVLATCIVYLMGAFPAVKTFVGEAIAIFTGSVTLYHVLAKPIGNALDAVDIPPVDPYGL